MAVFYSCETNFPKEFLNCYFGSSCFYSFEVAFKSLFFYFVSTCGLDDDLSDFESWDSVFDDFLSSLGLGRCLFLFISCIWENVGCCINIYVILFCARVLALPLTLSFIVNVYCSDLSLHSTQKHLFSHEKHFHSCELYSRKSLLLSFENYELETLTYIIFVEAIVTKTFMANPTTKKLLLFFLLFASMAHFCGLFFLHCIWEHRYLDRKLAWNNTRILSSN